MWPQEPGRHSLAGEAFPQEGQARPGKGAPHFMHRRSEVRVEALQAGQEAT